MGPVLVLWILLSTAACDLNVVRRLPGQDASLPCVAPDSSIRAVEWSRDDLKPDNVLLYSDGYLETDHQNPSFEGRVDLVDRDLKDRDVSLTLKNVSISDTGTYECRVASGGFGRKKRAVIKSEPIRIIRLQVTDSPGDRHLGLAVGAAGGLLLVAAGAVVGVLTYKRHKDKRSGPPDDDADEASGVKLV